MNALIQPILDLLSAVGDLVTIFLGVCVWRIMTNHLPHIDTRLKVIETRFDDHADGSCSASGHIACPYSASDHNNGI